MKKIKILTPIVTVAALSGTAMTIVSCGQTQAEKIVPTKLMLMEETTLKGLTDGADISQYNTLVIPESVRIVDTDAFNDSKIDYSSIKTIRFSNGIKQIKKNAFAGLKNLELIDYSNFNIDTITTLSVEQGAFGESLPLYCYIKLPNNIPSSSINELKSKLLTCGLPESWFVEKTEGHVEIASEKKDAKYDGIDPTKIETKLNKPIEANEKFEVSIKKTAGTDKVGIKLIGQPTYANQTLTYKVELSPDAGKTLADGDYAEYKVTILNKTTTSESNGETTNWVQIVDNCKITYKTPELYVTGIEVSQTKPSKVYHQGDTISKNDVLVQTIFNDRSKAPLDYGESGYTVEGIEDFNTGHTITETEARGGTLTFKIKYSKKAVGDFAKTITFNNIALKVETIIVTGASSITRGTNAQYSTSFIPADAQTTLNWSIEPYIIGQSTNGISVDQNGVVTVANQADTNPINIVATDSTNHQTVGKCTNVSINVPKVEGITFTQTYTSCFRGAGQQKYVFTAEVDKPTAKQQIDYSIKESQPSVEDEKVTINKKTGELKIGKLAQLGKQWTVVASATDGSGISAEAQFTVDIPEPTKINITNTGSSTIKRVQETATFTYSVEPEGAEQSIDWFATNTSGDPVAGLTISTEGVLSATDVVTKQDVHVYAKHKPVLKTTQPLSSEVLTVSIVYPEIQSVSITGGPKTDPLNPTRYSVDRGVTASTAFTAAPNPAGAYKDIKWSIEGTTAGDGTSIDETTGILTVGAQVNYTNKKFKVVATAYDENGDIKSTTSADVYYTIPPITDITIKAVRTPTPEKALEENTHDQGSTITYSVDAVNPVGAEMDVSFAFDPCSTQGIQCESTTARQCVVSAANNAKIGSDVNYTVKVTTDGKQSSGQPLEKTLTIKVVVPNFFDATLEKLNDVALEFEESDQDEAAAKAACGSFADIPYIEGAATVRESMFNFVKNKTRTIYGSDCYLADVCTHKLANGKYALFTFITKSAISAPWGNQAYYSDSSLYNTTFKNTDLYIGLSKASLNKTITRGDYSGSRNVDMFTLYINEFHPTGSLRFFSQYGYRTITKQYYGKTIATMSHYDNKQFYGGWVGGGDGYIERFGRCTKGSSSYYFFPMFCI